MGKKKNKRYQPTTNPFWSNIASNDKKQAEARVNLVNLGNVPKTPTNQQFQSPYHQQDLMADLTDDTSPNNPMYNAKKNPRGNTQEQPNQKSNLATQPIFDTSDNMEADEIKSEEPSVNTQSGSLSQSNWKPIKNAEEPNKNVVQGSASSIKLMVQGSKSLSVATSSTVTTANEKPKPTILASESVGSIFSLPKSAPNLTLKGVQQQVVKVEDIPKGQVFYVTKQINTIINRDKNQKPQQYKAPVKLQPVLPVSAVPQSPVQQYNMQNKPQPSAVLPVSAVPQTPVQQYNMQNNAHPSAVLPVSAVPQSPVQQYNMQNNAHPSAVLPVNAVSQSPVQQYNNQNNAHPSAVLPVNAVSQSPVQQYNMQNKSHPSAVLPVSAVPQTPVQQYNMQNSAHSSAGFQNYPKGIPKSFLMRTATQLPEPYSNSNMPDPNQQWVEPKQPVVAPNVIEYAYNYNPNVNRGYNENLPLYVHTTTENDPVVEKEAYSPSDVYADNLLGTAMDEDQEVNTIGSESPDPCGSREKRLSAFQRLGPLTEPKKPKLTINLLCNKDQSVREVVDETEKEPKYVPFHQRADITNSTNEIVMKYLLFWPWKKPLQLKKTVTFRNSRSVMILEQEQMVEIYEKNNVFIQVSVKGYPPKWNKEQVLDTLLDLVNGKSFIPCFTEFTPQECKFLVIRSRWALTVFHKIGFITHKDGHELYIAISQTELTLNKIEFIPKFILRKLLVSACSGENSLNLSYFTLTEEISHFIYFPLNRQHNQMDIVQQQTSVVWEYLTDINLSHNRLTSIDGFNLPVTTPRLKNLDLSFNHIEKVTLLLTCRSLPLQSIKLEGNPLCTDYTDPSYYVKVLKMMFPTLVEIDGIPIKRPGEMPTFKKNYCPEAATNVIEKFLEIYFPLLDSIDENRDKLRELYHERATMTVTTRYKLRYGSNFKSFRSLFSRSRVIDEDILDSIDGAKDIAKVIAKWPPLKHDPFTFTVDVLMHDDYTTIFKIGGLVRITAETLAEDEHLLAFTRTFVLHSYDGTEYKIANELVYWDEPTEECAHTAFQMTFKPKRLTLKLESTPDEDLKKQLIQIFMNLTEANESVSEKCLEQKEWNLKSALEHFMKLLKLDDLESLTKEINAYDS